MRGAVKSKAPALLGSRAGAFVLRAEGGLLFGGFLFATFLGSTFFAPGLFALERFGAFLFGFRLVALERRWGDYGQYPGYRWLHGTG